MSQKPEVKWPRVWRYKPFGSDQWLLTENFEEINGVVSEFLEYEEHQALVKEAVAKAERDLQELVDASEQLVYGAHGAAYLPGQLERFKKLVAKAQEARKA